MLSHFVYRNSLVQMMMITFSVSLWQNLDSTVQGTHFYHDRNNYQLCRDFGVLLYLYQPAFQCVSRGTILSLVSTLLLPCYLFVVVVLAVQMVRHLWMILAKK